MRVTFRRPRRDLEVSGPHTVRQLLEQLDIPAESVLVIRGNELLLLSDALAADDELEVRPVISGG